MLASLQERAEQSDAFTALFRHIPIVKGGKIAFQINFGSILGNAQTLQH